MRYRDRLAIGAAVALALDACSSTANTSSLLPHGVGSAAPVARTPSVHKASSPTLYISDLIANTVTLYPANVPSPAPIATISDGISNPKGIWVDKSGKLYVANSCLKAAPGTSPNIRQARRSRRLRYPVSFVRSASRPTRKATFMSAPARSIVEPLPSASTHRAAQSR